tara:strand:+ start:332 stop:1072 length:741 start_codon:yes stop_codon:yes gene_type:complete
MSSDRDASGSPIGTFVLSGLTSGLGRAVLEQLVFETCPVIGLGRDLSRVHDVVSSATSPVKLVDIDLENDSEAVTTVADSIPDTLEAEGATPLVFISNASIIEPIAKSLDLDTEDLNRSMRINCLSPLILANVLTRKTLAKGRTLLILNVSSGAAERAISGWQAYCTSKAAFKMALDVLAAENSHVKVVHFDPGVMDTPMQQHIRDQTTENMPQVATFRSYQSDGQLKNPAEVAFQLLSVVKSHLK